MNALELQPITLPKKETVTMTRDLNQLMQDVRNSREVFVTSDGVVESADEAAQNADRETQLQGAPKPRTNLKPEIFGA